MQRITYITSCDIRHVTYIIPYDVIRCPTISWLTYLMSGLERLGPQPHHHPEDVWGPGQHRRQGPHDRVGLETPLGRQAGLPRQEGGPDAALLRGVAARLRGGTMHSPAGYHILLHPTLLYYMFFHSILLHSILPHSTLVHYVPCYSIPPYCILFCRSWAIFHYIPAYSIMFHSVLLYPALLFPILRCPTLCHPALLHSIPL